MKGAELVNDEREVTSNTCKDYYSHLTVNPPGPKYPKCILFGPALTPKTLKSKVLKA